MALVLVHGADATRMEGGAAARSHSTALLCIAVGFDQGEDRQPDMLRDVRPREKEDFRDAFWVRSACILLASCLHPNRSLWVLSGIVCSLLTVLAIGLSLQRFLGILSGRAGIRTLERLSALPVFKTGAIDHSATLPSAYFSGVSSLLSTSHFRCFTTVCTTRTLAR